MGSHRRASCALASYCSGLRGVARKRAINQIRNVDVPIARTSLASGTQARARPAWRRGKGGVQANCNKMWKGCSQNRGGPIRQSHSHAHNTSYPSKRVTHANCEIHDAHRAPTVLAFVREWRKYAIVVIICLLLRPVTIPPIAPPWHVQCTALKHTGALASYGSFPDYDPLP